MKLLAKNHSALSSSVALMSEEEFYAKLDQSIASAEAGNTIAMMEGENVDLFIDRLLGMK